MTPATRVAETTRRERLVALSVTGVATIAFALAALGDAAAPLPAGHYASTASVGIVADNMLRWHVPWPVWSYTAGPPTADLAYGHHPWGIFWTTAAIFSVFGRSDFTCRLAPLLLSTATIPMLHAVGARLHRPIAGAAAAAMFAVLPISLAFATFNALEVPVIAWSVLSLWGFIGLWSPAPRRRDAIAFGLGVLLAVECDWPGFLTAGFLIGGGLAALARRRSLREGAAGKLRWGALLAAAAAVVAALVVQIAWLRAIGKWDDLLSSYDLRSAGKGAPLLQVLRSRRWWLELSFTKVGLALIVLSPLVMAWRARLGRRAIELAPLALGATAAIQYVVFRQGADVHVFWPQYFTPFVALGAAAMVAAGCDRATARRPSDRRLFWVAPALALLTALWVARDGVAALRYARSTGGRFDEHGLLIHSDADVIAAMRHAVPALAAEGVLQLDSGLKPTWSQGWALARPFEIRAGLPDAACASERGAGSPAAWLADLRFLAPPLLREIATQCRIRVVGPLVIVEPGAHEPLVAQRLDERAGSGLDGYLRATSEPLREAAADPFGTWELRLHLDQPTGDSPTEPRTVDEIRVARNIADLLGDAPARARWDAALAGHVRSLDAMFEDGTRLVGVVDAELPGQATTILVEAGGPLARGVELSVIGRVVERVTASPTMPDPYRREMAMPPRIAPPSWRAGWIYPVEVFIHPRPGREELRARLVSHGAARAPRPVTGAPDFVVATVSR